MFKMRIVFEKKDEASYISHLDLMRTLQRSFLRASLPVKYSEGFNPHICMSVLSPLPTGFSGENELCDVELTCDEIPENALLSLNAAMPRGISVKEVYGAQTKPSDIKAASYKLYAKDGKTEDIEKAFDSPLLTEKKTKKGVKTVDVCDYINDVKIISQNDATLMLLNLKMGEDQINPSHIVNALREGGFLPQDGSFVCVRTALLHKDNSIFK